MNRFFSIFAHFLFLSWGQVRTVALLFLLWCLEPEAELCTTSNPSSPRTTSLAAARWHRRPTPGRQCVSNGLWNSHWQAPRAIIRLLRKIELRAVSGRIRNCNVCWIDIVISCLTPFFDAKQMWIEPDGSVSPAIAAKPPLSCRRRQAFWNCAGLISHPLRAERLEEQLLYCLVYRHRYSTVNFGFRSTAYLWCWDGKRERKYGNLRAYFCTSAVGYWSLKRKEEKKVNLAPSPSVFVLSQCHLFGNT